MGYYINPPGQQDPRDWLRENAEHFLATKQDFADKDRAVKMLNEALGDKKAIVACVDNGPFRAALIVSGWPDCFAIAGPDDHRPVSYWFVALTELRDLGFDTVEIFARHLRGQP
jgi:hypothetical protein